MIRNLVMFLSVPAFMLCAALVVSQPEGTTWKLQLAYLFGFFCSAAGVGYSVGWFDE